MVLKGKAEGISIPFDAPLWSLTADGTIEYRNSEALLGVFESTPDVEALLPEGLELFSEPPQCAYWLSYYSDSTLGPYYEYIGMIMVIDEEGDFGYYFPYIYVTNDAALAAGRELAGAPKKLAKLDIRRDYEFIQGTMERPSGKRLITITQQLESMASKPILDSWLPKKTYLYSVRHLPPIKGVGGATELIKWYAVIDRHKDQRGREVAFMGPCTITYDSPSMADPIHNLKVGNVLASLYIQFDMALGAEKVLRKYR